METFDNIRFNGVFRDYQQGVLDNLGRHLKNGKIHVVAAPGSGKTVLGLELIRRLGKPALVLSPTVTIRRQWGERFEGMFLPGSKAAADFISYDLRAPKLVTSATYQALYAAFNRLAGEPEDDEESGESAEPAERTEDFSRFDLLSTVRGAGIGTICLDEAHHLRSEWQKALEEFVMALGPGVTIVALTATPPYDGTPAEWNRYISLCGEIDEEISVPQLVAQRNLCPHQDYILFNRPTDAEAAAVREHRRRAEACVQEIIRGPLLREILENSGLLARWRGMEEAVLENAGGFIALLCLAKAAGMELPEKLVRLLSPGGRLPAFSPAFAETAFDFVMGNPDTFTEETSEKLRRTLAQEGLIERGKTRVVSNDRLDRALVSSMGKLASIARIVEAEGGALGQGLRMLILTDYIKKDMLRLVGTGEPIRSMGTVPIFEAVRRSLPTGLNAAVLSGGLVVVPDAILGEMKSAALSGNIGCGAKPIGVTGYSEVTFGGGNRERVAIITEAFRRGLIHVLVGTKSLLGEGWDSPCINSLILASFVGSFVYSNQMRGRAIRVDPCGPGKVANIWHLVTVMPPEESFFRLSDGGAESGDYETLRRRFECFLAPSYDGTAIESGLDRTGLAVPPRDGQAMDEENERMLARAADRGGLSRMWEGAVNGSLHPEIVHVDEVPDRVWPRRFLFVNALNDAVLSILLAVLIRSLAVSARAAQSASSPMALLCAGLLLVLLPLTVIGYVRLLRFISPRRTIETLGNCVLKALTDIGEVESQGARLIVESDSSDTFILCSLRYAAAREKNVFARAMREMFTSIENPRYLLVKRQWFLIFTWEDCSQSYACPSVLAAKKEAAEALAERLRKAAGSFELWYTRNEAGRRLLLKCRRWSYINRNEIYVKGRKVAVSEWE